MGEAITDPSIASTASSRAMPLFSASRTPSLNASIWTAKERLIAIFIVTAVPFSPTWNTFGAIASSTGLARSSTSRPPPTISEAFPCSTVTDVPDTGASSMSAPAARTCSASARVFAGLAVLMST